MCGITGYISLTPDHSSKMLEFTVTRMRDTLTHRGPDSAGCWVDPAVGIALGHRRLAIIDLTVEGHQPMTSADGRYVVVFNGEIYNFQPIRADLEMRGHRFRSTSDTEVMLEAFSEWGISTALQRFIGMFAFAVWDRAERQLTLARDRMGEKPLYYGWAGETFLFGSELKALAAHPDFVPEINRDALAMFLRYSYVPAPHSIYRDIYKLPPGCLLKLPLESRSGNLLKPVQYWSLEQTVKAGLAEPFTGSDAEAIAALDDLLRDAISLQMISDVPLGAFLSGGVDSSAIVALMQTQSSQPVKTFTIGFNEGPYNEAEYAGAVARHLGTDHTELYVTARDALNVIPMLPSIYDEPFSDSSQIPTYLVAKLTRQHVTVSLSGDGGDELFGGYTRYHKWQRLWRKFGWFPEPLRHGVASSLSGLSPRHWTQLISPFRALFASSLAPERLGYRIHTLADVLRSDPQRELYLREVSHWLKPEAVVHGASEAPTIYTDQRRWISELDFFQQMMFMDMTAYLPNDILVKVDRASMQTSLESRVPLLDYRIVDFAWRLPLSMKIRNGQSKWLLRQVLYQYVPSDLIERPKMGFGVPLAEWIKGPLRDWAEALLDEQRLLDEGYFDARAIRTKWHENLTGTHDWHYYLWDVLMFQAWLECQRDL